MKRFIYRKKITFYQLHSFTYHVIEQEIKERVRNSENFMKDWP